MKAGRFDSTGLLRIPIGSPEGLTLSRNAVNPNTQLDIAAGRAVVATSSGDRYIAISGSSFTKRLDAVWSTGTGNGGRFSGTVAANQTWHVFVLRNDTTGAIDFGFDMSLTASNTAANAPAGWSTRIIGSILTDGSSNIRDFVQRGDRFLLSSFVIALSTSALSQSNTNLVALTVPSGLFVNALVGFSAASTIYNSVTVGSPLISPGSISGSLVIDMSTTELRIPYAEIETNTAQARVWASGSGVSFNLWTNGWMNPRGAF